MKTTQTLALAALTVGALAVAPAAVLAHGFHGEGHGDHEVNPLVLEKFDKNKDGKLDEAERKEAHAAMKDMRQERMLEKFDANKDGTLDESERAAMKAEHEKRKQEMLAKYDTNKDGKLDETERQAARAEWKSHHGEHGERP